MRWWRHVLSTQVRDGLQADPAIVCGYDNPEYMSLYYGAWIGVALYLAVFFVFGLGLWKTPTFFNFLSDKYDDDLFFWELILVGRKVGLMVSFLFFSGTAGWLFGMMILITCTVGHAYTRPYNDRLTDVAEFFSLIATLFVALSAIAFAVLDDPENPNMTENARLVSKACEVASIIMICATLFLSIFVQIRVYTSVRKDRPGEPSYRDSTRLSLVRIQAEALEHTIMSITKTQSQAPGQEIRNVRELAEALKTMADELTDHRQLLRQQAEELEIIAEDLSQDSKENQQDDAEDNPVFEAESREPKAEEEQDSQRKAH
jgi:hypothetical protein